MKRNVQGRIFRRISLRVLNPNFRKGKGKTICLLFLFAVIIIKVNALFF